MQNTPTFHFTVNRTLYNLLFVVSQWYCVSQSFSLGVQQSNVNLLISPEMALIIGVLTVLYSRGLECCDVPNVAPTYFLLRIKVFGVTYFQKHIVKLTFRCNFFVHKEARVTFFLLDVGGDLKAQGSYQSSPGS